MMWVGRKASRLASAVFPMSASSAACSWLCWSPGSCGEGTNPASGAENRLGKLVREM